MAGVGLPVPIATWRCRWCGGGRGDVVLDLGTQPAADHFPLPDAPIPDPAYPLRMVLCRDCGLAQLEDDPTTAAEPRGVEPAALVEQARAAVRDLAGAGLARAGQRVAEFPSPHGGSWLGLLAAQGLAEAVGDQRADLVVDSLGIMHEPDQRAGLERRVRRLAPDGVLAVHVHPLATIVRDGTWNALRHGHFAYLGAASLLDMAGELGLEPVGAWRYGLYGGTVMIAFARAGSAAAASRDEGAEAARDAAAGELAAGVRDAATVATLGAHVGASGDALRAYLDGARAAGLSVAGYGAASRAVALLAVASVTAADLAVVADASPAKAGRCLPGSRVPIVGPGELAAMRPDRVLLFVPDLLAEVRAALPEVEAAGGRWVVVEPEPREVLPLSPPR
ncbi:MAG TPA: class I SAM-dependent methyltransferase [Cellulomonas sp.]